MKKRSAKTKGATKSKAAAKSKPRTGKAPAAARSRSTGPATYTPAPLKGDGWPPFRYPLI